MSSTFSRVKTISFKKTRAAVSAGQKLNKGVMRLSLEVITQVQKSREGRFDLISLHRVQHWNTQNLLSEHSDGWGKKWK
jgi:hypothetical protein